MANFGQLILTNLGLQAQVGAQSGGELKFKRIAMGSGDFEGNAATLTKLVKENVSLPISSGYIQNNAYTVEGFFSNEDLLTGFEWREVGVYIEGSDGGEILYCYANAGEAYDYIPATEDERYSKYIRVAMVVGNTTNVSIVESEGIIYVDKRTFDNTVENINLAMQGHKKDLNSHLSNKSNPHSVTTTQIGAADDLLSNLQAATTASRNLLYRGTLNTSNIKSANTYTSIGIYKVYLDGVSGSDFDFPTPYGIFVVNSSMDGTSYDYVSQMFYAMGNSRIYTRSSSDKGATWTEWQQAASNADLTTHTSNKKNPHGVTCEQIGAVPSANSLAKDVDLDTVVTSGFYRINESPINAPADVAYSQMLVVRGGNDTVAQMIFPYSQSRMFFRTGNPPSAGGTGAWKDWAQVYTSFNKPTAADVGALPTSGGGTVSADNIRPIVVKNTADNAAYTRYDGKDGILGFLGFSASGNARVLDPNGASLGDVYHTGKKPSPADIGAAAASHGNHVPTTQTANNATFLRNDNTWQKVTPANIGAAAASHGNHVPTTQTANNATFLRNDNTWQKVTPANIGAAPAHTWGTEDITAGSASTEPNGTLHLVIE